LPLDLTYETTFEKPFTGKSYWQGQCHPIDILFGEDIEFQIRFPAGSCKKFTEMLINNLKMVRLNKASLEEHFDASKWG
jgi:hypothetical protein